MRKNALIELAKSVCTVLQEGLSDKTIPGTKIKIDITPQIIELSISDEYQLSNKKTGKNYKLFIYKPYGDWDDITLAENTYLKMHGEFYDPDEEEKEGR